MELGEEPGVATVFIEEVAYWESEGRRHRRPPERSAIQEF
jgi:hypothetical protein